MVNRTARIFSLLVLSTVVIVVLLNNQSEQVQDRRLSPLHTQRTPLQYVEEIQGRITDRSDDPSIGESEIDLMEPSLTLGQPGERDIGSMFMFSDNFAFPHPNVKSRDQLQQSGWMQELKLILSRWKGDDKMVMMVTSNYGYREVLLNWLISTVVVTKLSLGNIVVVSFDDETHSLLQARGISTILVVPSSLFKKSKPASLGQVWTTRLVIMRLINHWGFDVAHFDSDALIVKDPQPLFQVYSNRGIIGSQGTYPPKLSKKWGATLCAGMMVIRSGLETEGYWQVMSGILKKSYSDQERLNYALEALHIQWQQNESTTNPIEGHCNNGLTVSILPYSDVCRSNCKRSQLGSYYVWHKIGDKNSKSKKVTASEGNLWFLRGDWTTHCGSRELSGEDWLKCIATFLSQ